MDNSCRLIVVDGLRNLDKPLPGKETAFNLMSPHPLTALPVNHQLPSAQALIVP